YSVKYLAVDCWGFHTPGCCTEPLSGTFLHCCPMRHRVQHRKCLHLCNSVETSAHDVCLPCARQTRPIPGAAPSARRLDLYACPSVWFPCHSPISAHSCCRE